MRKCLITGLMALFVLTGLVFGQAYDEVFTTGWMAADEDSDGTPEWENMFMMFLRDINGDGNANFCIIKTSDTYYTDWTTTHADFYGADFTPFWTIEDASVAPLYLTHADMDGDGKIEIVFTGRDNEDTDLTSEIIRSLVEVYDVGSQVPEWDYETDQGISIIGMTGPSYRFDNDLIPDLLLLGDWFASFDTYLFRSTAANTYERLWQSQGEYQSRVLVNLDYDFDGDYEIMLCEIEDQSQTENDLKLYDYDPGTDRVVRERIWYRDELFILPDQACDIDGDGSPELLIRTFDSLRSSYNLKLINGDSEQELFGFGEQLLDDSMTYGAVFWEDGFGGHDLDMDGNPELLYYAILWEERADGEMQPAERSCYIVEYEGGVFVDRFVQDPDEELMSVQVYDLDGDGIRELCLYYFHWIGTSGSYTNRLVVYDPTNNYQEKFRVEHSNVQPVGYTAPVQGDGVDLDGDGVGEFVLQIYESVGLDDSQYKLEIYDGATGELEWEKQYGRGTAVRVGWADEETTYAGITYPATDFNGNGNIDFGVSEFQFEDEELIAAKYSIFEGSGVAPPPLKIWVETDKANYLPGETIDLKIGGYNTGAGILVDIYIAIVKSDGSIHCAPSWLPGIRPWISNFGFPPDFSMMPGTFFTFTLPCDLPPINSGGEYLFAGALTPPGEFTFLDLELAVFTLGML